MAPLSGAGSRQDGLYAEAAATYGAALDRLAHAYEPDAERRLDLGLRGSLDFHRVQLERQRDLLRSVWSWALLPFVPGFLVLQIGLALALPARTARFIVIGVLFVVLTVGLHALNRRVAARIQQRLDRLKENP